MGQGRVGHWFGQRYLLIIERMWAQSWAQIPRPPERLTVVRGTGPNPNRVLLAGGSSAVGWGALTHELALAGYLARLTPAATGRGMDLEVLSTPATTARDIVSHLGEHRASLYDAIVLTLGTREAFEFMPVDMWTSTLADLLDRIASSSDPPPPVLVVGAEETTPVPVPSWFSRIVMNRAARFNAASRDLVAGRDRVEYVDSAMVSGSDGLYDTDYAALYTTSAQAIADALAPLLQHSHQGQLHPVVEEDRRHALEHLRSFTGNLAAVTRLLTTLRDVLSVHSTDLYVVDRDTVRLLATTGRAAPGQDRKATVSSMALDNRHGLVVPDLRLDERFRDRPEVTGAPHLRFYAAFPVESPDGQRVALLSIVHTEPREFPPNDFALMRSFSIAIGDVLFEGY